MVQDEIDWASRVATEVVIDDSDFVRFCRAQLQEDLLYIRADAKYKKDRFARRVAESTINLVELNYSQVRTRACQLMTELLDEQPEDRTLESFVRQCVAQAFMDVYSEQFALIEARLQLRPQNS